MKSIKIILILLFATTFIHSQDLGLVAKKPLFRDPIFDGAADPVVIYNPKVKKWWMFYTNRRANMPNLSGVTWVHGTPIGIAESADNGASWKYVDDAKIKIPESISSKTPTYWAPDVIRGDDGKFYMFLTVVPGIFEDWQHPRNIVQLVSKDLRKWDYLQTLPLTDKVIDAAVFKMPDGKWHLWYNNEKDKKTTYWAESPDLKTWTDRGKAINNRGEGPKVFRWQGKIWMVFDEWKGLGIYRSDDASNWEKQSYNLLDTPGKGEDDQVQGGHPDVVVSGERAFLFYFTHPGRRGADAKKDTTEQRRSSIQVVELKMKDGWLTCERDEPTYIKLIPNKE